VRSASAQNAHSGGGDAGVEILRVALVRKAYAKGVIVVLDAAHFGALASRKLVEACLAAHGSPIDEFGFRDAWIVGPTIRSSLRICG
jgi:hypothetical protein